MDLGRSIRRNRKAKAKKTRRPAKAKGATKAKGRAKAKGTAKAKGAAKAKSTARARGAARTKGAARAKGSAGKKRARRPAKAKSTRRPARKRSRRGPSGRKTARAAPVRVGRLSLHPVLAALLLAGTGLGLGYLIAIAFLFPAGEQSVELQAVPDIRGEPLELALATVIDSGLVIGHVDSVRHPRAEAGLVLGQSPLPGLTALVQAPVRITVSSGPEMRAVPDLTRLAGDRAAELLDAGGFVVRVDTADSRTPAGRVLGIDPAPGTEIRIPGDVRLVVSRGPPTFPMPQLAGMTQGEAYAVLRSLGLELGEVDRRYSLLNVRVVFGQDPEPRVPVAEGTAVRLIVGREVRPAPQMPGAMERPDLNGDNNEPPSAPWR